MSKFLIILANKKYLIFGALFFVFCFLPLCSVFAISGWDYLNPLVWIGKAITLIFTVFLYIARGFLWASTMILTWAIGNPWAVSFTDPAGNDIIKIGWVLLRDFTNMFFILGLAYIGLATSLGLSGFKTKDTFIRILLIALVINFTPVICGVIVDICNIISRFFLIGIDFSATEKAYNEQMGVIWNGLDNIVSDWKVAVQAIMLFVYGIFTALVLLIFALIFLVRAPIIWIYVILSPIAFFFWVFPNFQKWHSKWWNGFLEWCFIAIPGAFFLYLSQQVMVAATGGKLIDASGLDSGFFASLAPYFATLIFLVIGLCITIKINGMATGAVMALAGVATGGIATGVAAGLKKGGGKVKNAIDKRYGTPPGDNTPPPRPDDGRIRTEYGSNIGEGFGGQQYAGTTMGTSTGGAYARREAEKIPQYTDTSADARSKDTLEFGGFKGGEAPKHGGFKGGEASKNRFGMHGRKSEEKTEEADRKKEVVQKGISPAERVLKDLILHYQGTENIRDEKTGKIIGKKPKTFYGGKAGWVASNIGKGIKFAHKYVLSPIYKGAMKKPTTHGAAFDVFWQTAGHKKKSKAEIVAEIMGIDKEAIEKSLKKKEKEKREEKEKKEKEEEANKEKENKT